MDTDGIEITRGYEVLSDNSIRFGIRVNNKGKTAISDVEIILDFPDSLFSLETERILKLGNIPPSTSRTAKFVLKPLSCIHNEKIGGNVLYKDSEWQMHVEHINQKEIHCVCPFLKGKPMKRSEFVALASRGTSAESGMNFKGVSSEKIISFLTQTCKNRLYKVDEYNIGEEKVLYFAAESIGEKLLYLLTVVVKSEGDITQVLFQATTTENHGLNGFLNEITSDLKHLVSTVQSAQEIGVVKKEQVINIIDSVVQRTNFNVDDSTNFNFKESVLQRPEIKTNNQESDSVVQRTNFNDDDSTNFNFKESVLQRPEIKTNNQESYEEKNVTGVKSNYSSQSNRLNKYIKIIALSILIVLIIPTLGLMNPDSDKDGYPDEEDAFPDDPRYHEDSDSDGYADEIDDFPTQVRYHKDSDGDGYADEEDAFPKDSRYHKDSDGDGYADEVDAFPKDSRYHKDSDGDGYADEIDELPNNSEFHSKTDYYEKMIVGTWINEDFETIITFDNDNTCYGGDYENIYQTLDGTYHWTNVEEEPETYEIIDEEDFEMINDGEVCLHIIGEAYLFIKKIDDDELILSEEGAVAIAFKRLK